jgi:hypothetical protein
MSNSLPTAKSQTKPNERQRLRRVAERRGLCGLANNTKWDEFISAIRGRGGWRPAYRYRCIDGPPSSWDVEWYYHLPFPFISVEWLDVAFLQKMREHRLPAQIHTIDHSSWIEEVLQRIGLDYEKGTKMIRIFGYSPKSHDLFDE